MKFLFFICLLSTTTLFAQSNNPEDQVGVNFVLSLAKIHQDIDSGYVSEIDEATVASYSRTLPLKLAANFEDVANMASQIRDFAGNLQGALDASQLSAFSKETLLEVVSKTASLSRLDYMSFLEIKVYQILEYSLPEMEKKFLLSMTAISYNLIKSNFQSSSTEALKKKDCYCTVTGPDGSGQVNCTVCGVIIGGVVGSLICGPWPCGAIGAVVGGIIGTLVSK